MSEQENVATKPAIATPEIFDLRSAVEFGRKQTFATDYKGVPIYAIPKDMELHTLNELVNAQLPRPYKLEQTVELLTEESFVEYFNRYATASSTIFVNDTDNTLIAVLDYHDSPTEPAWKHHRATYKLPKTKEWDSWNKNNNVRMTQEEFALFIEENLREIIEPNGADMLQIAATLKAKNNIDFKSSTRLDNGEIQFAYIESIQGQAGINGQMTIPEVFSLAIAPFLRGAPYQIEARLRYRINPSGLQLWYTLIRPHTFADHAFTEIVDRIKEKMAKGQLVHGRI